MIVMMMTMLLMMLIVVMVMMMMMTMRVMAMIMTMMMMMMVMVMVVMVAVMMVVMMMMATVMMIMVMVVIVAAEHTQKKTIRRSSSSFLSPARSPTIPLTFPRSSSSPHSSSFPCLSSPLPLPSLLLLLIIFLILLFPLESCTSTRKPKARAYNGLCLCLGFLPEVWFFGFSQWFCFVFFSLRFGSFGFLVFHLCLLIIVWLSHGSWSES